MQNKQNIFRWWQKKGKMKASQATRHFAANANIPQKVGRVKNRKWTSGTVLATKVITIYIYLFKLYYFLNIKGIYF